MDGREICDWMTEWVTKMINHFGSFRVLLKSQIIIAVSGKKYGVVEMGGL